MDAALATRAAPVDVNVQPVSPSDASSRLSVKGLPTVIFFESGMNSAVPPVFSQPEPSVLVVPQKYSLSGMPSPKRE